MIDAIIFDVGGVLIADPWPGMVKHYTQHLNVKKELFLAAFNEIARQWQSGLLKETHFWQKMCTKLQSSLPTSESLWLEGFTSTYKERRTVFRLIKSLKKKGYKIGLLSNTEVPIMHFLIERQYSDFDAFVYSCSSGKIKPDADIYHEMLEKLETVAEHTVFIDDKLENIEGAQKVGMMGIHFQTVQQVKNELRRLGV